MGAGGHKGGGVTLPFRPRFRAEGEGALMRGRRRGAKGREGSRAKMGGVRFQLCAWPQFACPLCAQTWAGRGTQRVAGDGSGNGGAHPLWRWHFCTKGRGGWEGTTERRGGCTRCLHVIYPCIYSVYSQIGDKKKRKGKSRSLKPS